VLLDEYNRTIIEKRNFETLLNTQKRKNDSKSYNHKKDNNETDKSIMEIKNYNYNSKFIADLQSLIYNAEKSWLLLGYF
jgi:hypothetical protein